MDSFDYKSHGIANLDTGRRLQYFNGLKLTLIVQSPPRITVAAGERDPYFHPGRPGIYLPRMIYNQIGVCNDDNRVREYVDTSTKRCPHKEWRLDIRDAECHRANRWRGKGRRCLVGTRCDKDTCDE
jgi:hypothetical protein